MQTYRYKLAITLQLALCSQPEHSQAAGDECSAWCVLCEKISKEYLRSKPNQTVPPCVIIFLTPVTRTEPEWRNYAKRIIQMAATLWCKISSFTYFKSSLYSALLPVFQPMYYVSKNVCVCVHACLLFHSYSQSTLCTKHLLHVLVVCVNFTHLAMPSYHTTHYFQSLLQGVWS